MTTRPLASRVLADAYGRVATDLRVSLTDRCNLRCTYCMPAEGLDWLPPHELLTDDEIVRLITIGVRAARRRARCGSPVASRCCAAAWSTSCAGTAALRAAPGDLADDQRLGLARTAPALATPGSTGSTSASTPSTAERFHAITRRDRLADVLAGPRGRRGGRAAPVKVNAVLLRGVNDDEAPDAAAVGLEHGYELRFIEQMPLDAQHGWDRDADGDRRRDPRRAASGVHADARRRAAGQRAGRAVGSSTAARPRSASSPRSPGRSAATATASGSPPTARSATACSPARRPTCGRALRGGADDEEIAERWRGAMGPSGPATASTTRRSCSPTGRCPPSAASDALVSAVSRLSKIGAPPGARADATMSHAGGARLRPARRPRVGGGCAVSRVAGRSVAPGLAQSRRKWLEHGDLSRASG